MLAQSGGFAMSENSASGFHVWDALSGFKHIGVGTSWAGPLKAFSIRYQKKSSGLIE